MAKNVTKRTKLDVAETLDELYRIDEQFAEYQRAVEALALVHRGTLAAYKRLKEET